MAKFASNVSGAMLLPSLIQATESISGSIVPLVMFFGTFVEREWLLQRAWSNYEVVLRYFFFRVSQWVQKQTRLLSVPFRLVPQEISLPKTVKTEV